MLHLRKLVDSRAQGIVVVLIMALAMLAAGCGEKDPGPQGIGLGGGGSAAQQKQDYEDAQEQMRSAIEDPASAPLERSISTGNRNELLAAAQRWDQATSIAKSLTPPEDIKAIHTDLVGAMEGLGKWNLKIAQAAPNKQATKKAARQARKSGEAKRFQAAVQALEAKGYVTFVSATEEPLDTASDPTS